MSAHTNKTNRTTGLDVAHEDGLVDAISGLTELDGQIARVLEARDRGDGDAERAAWRAIDAMGPRARASALRTMAALADLHDAHHDIDVTDRVMERLHGAGVAVHARAEQATPAQPAWRGRKRRRVGMGLVATLLGVAVAVGLLMFAPPRSGQAPAPMATLDFGGAARVLPALDEPLPAVPPAALVFETAPLTMGDTSRYEGLPTDWLAGLGGMPTTNDVLMALRVPPRPGVYNTPSDSAAPHALGTGVDLGLGLRPPVPGSVDPRWESAWRARGLWQWGRPVPAATPTDSPAIPR